MQRDVNGHAKAKRASPFQGSESGPRAQGPILMKASLSPPYPSVSLTILWPEELFQCYIKPKGFPFLSQPFLSLN